MGVKSTFYGTETNYGSKVCFLGQRSGFGLFLEKNMSGIGLFFYLFLGLHKLSVIWS